MSFSTPQDLGQDDPWDASLRSSRPRLFTSSKFQEADNGEPEQVRDKKRRDTGEVLSVGGGHFDGRIGGVGGG